MTRTKTPSHSEADISKLSGFPSLTSYQAHHSGHKHSATLDHSGHGHGHVEEDAMALFRQLKDSRYTLSHTQQLMLSEYKRLGWRQGDKRSPLRVCRLNEHYDLCATYPTLLLLPAAAKDNLIKRAAQHRSRNRLPVITWSNAYNITLARSSQPQSGAGHKRNEYDERLLLLLNEMNSYSETFVICDCRPRVNAIANQYMKGKGFEHGDNY